MLGGSRIYTKALWILPTTRQRGYPNTCVHNADHLREVRHNVGIWNQAKPEDKLPTSTLWESTKPSTYVVFYLQITNHESDFDSNSIALQEKGWCWSTMSATSLMLLIVPCSYTQIQGFFVKVLNCYHEVQWCWPSLLEFAFGTRQQRNCSLPRYGKIQSLACMHFLSENDFDAFLEKDDADPAWDRQHFQTWERQQPRYRTRTLDLLIELLV